MLEVKSIDDHGQQHFRKVKIRNPLGRSSWRGDWNIDSPLWTRYPGVQAACRPYECGNGVFWMSFDDFRVHFHNVDVCKVREGKSLDRIPSHGDCHGTETWLTRSKKNGWIRVGCLWMGYILGFVDEGAADAL